MQLHFIITNKKKPKRDFVAAAIVAMLNMGVTLGRLDGHTSFACLPLRFIFVLAFLLMFIFILVFKRYFFNNVCWRLLCLSFHSVYLVCKSQCVTLFAATCNI